MYRKATEEDAYELGKLYLDFSIKNHATQGTSLKDTRREVYERIALKTLRNRSVDTYIARFNEIDVGFISFYTIEHQRILIIDDIFVQDSSSGNGIGSYMISLAETIAKKKGYITKLEVYEWNTDAIKFYEKRGYVKDSIVLTKQ